MPAYLLEFYILLELRYFKCRHVLLEFNILNSNNLGLHNDLNLSIFELYPRLVVSKGVIVNNVLFTP